MNTILTPSQFAVRHSPYAKSVPITDVTACVKSWGRRGIFWGAVFGFALGMMLVAIPLSTDILTFGVVGTLLVAAVECAVIAGGFAALAGALFGEGGHSRPRPEAISMARRRVADTGWRNSEIPLGEWPYRAAGAAPTTLPLGSDGDWSTASSLQTIQTRLNSIDAWEHGNTGP